MDEEIIPSKILLPELWMEIFSKLPAKTLVRSRCVCKSWRSMIDNPSFISMHITRFKNNFNKHFLLSFETHNSFDDDQFELKIRVRTMGKFRKREQILGLTFSADDYHIDYKGYVDGLLLFGRYYVGSYDLFLLNPSIRKSIVLPQIPSSPAGRAETVIGFDPVKNDYKVVMILFPIRLVDHTFPDSIMVYEFRIGEWRFNTGLEIPHEWFLGENVLTKGVVHWLSFNLFLQLPLPKNYTHIVSFNFGTETFSYTELPGDRSDDYEKITYPFLLGDSLAVLDISLDLVDVYHANFCIWVMTKCGGNWTESWSKRDHKVIGLDTFGFFQEYKYNIRNLLYVESIQKFLLEVNGKVKSYDLESHKIKELESSDGCYSMIPYVESLLLCKRLEEECHDCDSD
ncbi:F-box protein CPR1 [Bienertia sinuspersici]